MVLTEPTLFFKARYPETSFTYAFAFGIIVCWIASFLEWLTRIIRHETLFDSLAKIKESLQELPFWKNVPENFWAQNVPEPSTVMPAWLVEVFGIVLSPFQALLKITFYGMVIFVGAYLLVPKQDHTNRDTIELKHTIRIVAFSVTPALITALLGFLPMGLAGLIGWIYSIVLLVVGLSTRFGVSKARALGVVALPGILSFVFVGCIIGVFAGLFFGLIASIFSSVTS
jgi:hypothetical protein